MLVYSLIGPVTFFLVTDTFETAGMNYNVTVQSIILFFHSR